MSYVDTDIEYYRSLQNGMSYENSKDILAAETRRRLKEDMLTSINCEFDAQRNGEDQIFVVTTTEQVDKMDIISLPEEELYIGDIIWCYEKNWIVKEVYATPFLQMKGKMICCNLDLKFQIEPSSQIYTRPVCLDSGVYATAQKSQPELTIPDQQYKMYAQIDDATKHLYSGKRIAAGKWYGEDGDAHLICYEITAVDSTSLNFYDGHIVEFKLRAIQDDPNKDSIDEMICDYIPNDQARDTYARGGW